MLLCLQGALADAVLAGVDVDVGIAPSKLVTLAKSGEGDYWSPA